ncbi:MAG TPA: biosynthetic arginine decarboxylase [Gammaproteobacteria bacterium]|nr:biosynthetic arginine decarboxylase [Gammaproteobacteria bacterium]
MWTTDQARTTYNLAHWGEGYFDVSRQGCLVVRPGRSGTGVDLFALAAELRESGLSWPVLVRFNGILRDRVDSLCGAFDRAMAGDGYTGAFTAVYPIKVNQQRSVVEQILARGNGRVGLEAGSKPELMAVLALSRPDGVVICNGYKDREYIRLALIGTRLGHRIHIVVEKLSELDLVIRESRALGIEPLLGVRIRLASIGAGKWQNTGGEKSKFGLQAAQVLNVIERLRGAGMSGALQLLHCHLGSQVANIRDIQRGMREIACYYAELRAMGLPVGTIDVGGGLGVDYEGTRSRSDCSINYNIQEYANNVVRAIREICAERELPHPDIITESGRAMTAHHAVLITNVIDIDQAPGTGAVEPPAEDEPLIIQDLWQVLSELSDRPPLESYHDASHWLAEAQSMYLHGVLSIEQRARVESLYFAICHRVQPLLQGAKREHRDVLDELNEKLADKYFCNLSVFQSLPDVWAIDQIFPIMPLHRLDEPPTRRAVLQDLTCDSDGHIGRYVEGSGVESTLPVHPCRPGEPYLLGVFLVGAYQEILGDMHNLFGDTNAVNVEAAEDGGHRLLQPEHGDTVDELLSYVHYATDALREAYRRKISQAPGLSAREQASYLEELEAGLGGYTYLED